MKFKVNLLKIDKEEQDSEGKPYKISFNQAQPPDFQQQKNVFKPAYKRSQLRVVKRIKKLRGNSG